MEEQKQLRWAKKQLIPMTENSMEEFLQQKNCRLKDVASQVDKGVEMNGHSVLIKGDLLLIQHGAHFMFVKKKVDPCTVSFC